MPNPEICQKRAQECRRKADIVSDPRARAQWVKLAEGWMAFSRFALHTDTNVDKGRAAQTGLWRGDSVDRARAIR